MKRIIGFLKKDIPQGTPIIDLYEDGDLYYEINNEYIPVDFNNFKHSEWIAK